MKNAAIVYLEEKKLDTNFDFDEEAKRVLP